MTPEYRVELVGMDAVRKLVREMPDRQFEGAKTAFQATAADVHGKVSDGINDGNPLHNRSGVLKRSLKHAVYGNDLGSLHSDVWSDVVYAPIQETGGKVEAKKAYKGVPGGPYLNIPLPANKTPAGVTRMQAKEVFASGGFLVRSGAGNWLVMLNGQPMFVLKKEVTIPPRLGMEKAANDAVPTLLSRLKDAPLE